MSKQSLLRIVTAGSVDDGKSTLIGRLLFESKAILSDQLAAISRSRFQRTSDGSLDLSLLTDGLEAEREQGITIDVAYRYFSTPARKYILADAPGHEQYTRNMMTGASTADVVIVLIDATRVVDGSLLPQTKRHSAIAKILDVQHVIVAVNKMDRVDFDEGKFREIETAYRALASSLGFAVKQIIPICALRGDNVVTRSVAMPWYEGDALLTLLEQLPGAADLKHLADASTLCFPVQWVVRANGSTENEFRGYAGRVTSGRVALGQTVAVAGQEAMVSGIFLGERALSDATSGQSVTIVLDRELDISRGDVIASATNPPARASTVRADVCWLDTQPLVANRRYALKLGAAMVLTKADAVHSTLDVATLSLASTGEKTLRLNDIGDVELRLQTPIACARYKDNREMGAFVLIDPATNQTAAAGMIRAYA